jgi:hypothetical protein
MQANHVFAAMLPFQSSYSCKIPPFFLQTVSRKREDFSQGMRFLQIALSVGGGVGATPNSIFFILKF